MDQVLKEAVANQLKNSDQRFQYTYQEKETVEDLAANDQVKKSETKTYLWFHTEYNTFLKLTSLNGAAYDAGYLRTQDEKIRQLMEEDERRPEPEKRKVKDKIRRERAEESALFRNLQEGFLFQCEGRETINGYAAWVFRFEPRPGFEPQDRASEIMTGLAGKLWITEEERHAGISPKRRLVKTASNIAKVRTRKSIWNFGTKLSAAEFHKGKP
jgi:hypothetical protein